MKIAFLDRDGTINRDYPDAEWAAITEPELLDGAIGGMKYILEKGYKIIIITNQYTIGEGIISQDQYDKFNERLLAVLNQNGITVLDVFYCPHARWAGCDCCKPKPGMITRAMAKYPDINLDNSFMCGDSSADMAFAKAAGLRFIGINIGECRIDNLSELRRYV